MVIPPEITSAIDDLLRRVASLVRFTAVDEKNREIADLEREMSAANFWDNPESAKNVLRRISHLKEIIAPVLALQTKIADLDAFLDLLKDEHDESLLRDFEAEVKRLSQELDALELASFLSGKHDHANAILSIHAGVGGTESCDWADMLLRMYLRWAERRGFDTEIQDMQAGDGAGISRVTVRIVGPSAYGYAKAERGVHRLVRISPFDANKRRHTSFCSVDVVAELEDDDGEIEICDDEIRIDTYRASGKGGQHVNKTESAIRITHLATGIVVTCQNARSQYKNKDFALKMLRSRLYERMEDEKRSEMERFYGEKGEIGWGNQIRSYIFQPYQLVKDLRTGAESGNVQAVMDGEIDFFINYWLRAGSPKARRQGISAD
ncbi:MAG: peptide chain release factor 2 [Puniceicoccales bacterium]|nr:peptide chain release factor 2 [Puniceicoccales bacterium]